MTARRTVALAAAALVLSAAPAPAASPLPDLSCLALPTAVPRVLVGVVPGTPLSTVRVPGGVVSGRIAPLNVVEVAFRTPAAATAGLAAVRAARWVRWAEPETTMHQDTSPSDPMLPLQWGIAKIGAPRAWNVEVGTSNPVTVAVLDTGVSFSHPDLAGHVTPGLDFVNGDRDPSDDEFHGTHVTGIVAAATDNHLGMAGVSWGANVLVEKVLGADGSGGTCGIAAAMVHAARAGARVLNLSLGATNESCPVVMEEALRYTAARDALVVVSAGNKGNKGNPVQYPAGCDGVAAVGATDDHDRIATFSTHQPYVALSAPGVSILSTYRMPNGANKYALLQGTSMAAPFVSGLAALLFAAHPTWTSAQVLDRMEKTAVDLGPHGRDPWFGFGRIDARRALGG